jgi:hypothetical protein
MAETPAAVAATSALRLRRIATWAGIRVLAWKDNILYAGRGYDVIGMDVRTVSARGGATAQWEVVARFRPAWWRNLTSRNTVGSRLMRDGFHALTVAGSSVDDRIMVGAVPGAIVTRDWGSDTFNVTHRIGRGTRPLHITAAPSGTIYWGEYFDNRERAEVHIYASTDRGRTWHVAYTFGAGSIRHVHNIVYDRWRDCLWILTGDEGAECKVLCASCDLSAVELVLAGNQQARAVAAIPTENAVYFSTDTPVEKNHVYRLDCRIGGRREVERVADLASSSIYGCRVSCGFGEAMFFSTMVEPSSLNTGREVHLAGSRDGMNWQVLARWKKDNLPMRYFQYGNAFLPDGENASHYLAATTIAVDADDLATTMWEVEAA